MEKRLSIQQMVIATGLSAHTLRYYERIGLIQPGRDHSSGYRSYNEQDVNLIEFIIAGAWRTRSARSTNIWQRSLPRLRITRHGMHRVCRQPCRF